jgi:DNA polymerase I-like protein with 3'-5' exonuclease and polymerase domains
MKPILERGYKIVLLKQEAIDILRSLKGEVCVLDFETTALSPDHGRVRLTNLMHPDWEQAVLFDHNFCGSFRDLIEEYADITWVVYNAKFELRWFDFIKPGMADVVDVDFYAKVKLGGGVSSLARMAQRDLKLVLDKDEQKSDWGAPKLSEQQYHYAAYDALVTCALLQYWRNEFQDYPIPTYMSAGGEYNAEQVYTINDAVRPTIECEDTGMVLDSEYHETVIKSWQDRQATALRYVRKMVPSSKLENLNSGKQLSDFFKATLGPKVIAAWPKTGKTGQLQTDQDTLKTIASQMPYPLSRWMVALVLFKFYGKYLSTYGDTLITKQFLEDKITYRLNIAQAATKRYSSSSINIQNIPRAAYVRKSFLPPAGYEFLVTADYSGIEIRTLAEISGDKDLTHDAIYTNMHASMAAISHGIPEDEYLVHLKGGDPRYKLWRTQAKVGTFRLTYGAGAGAIAQSMNSSVEAAEDFVAKWARRYPVAYGYRQKMFDIMSSTGFLLMHDGSTIYVPKADRTLPVAANYGVQGTAALVMLRAMARVREERNRRFLKEEIVIVASVHDEMVLAVKSMDYIDHAKEVLSIGMTKAWLDVFPNSDTHNLLESGHGVNWGECK